MGTAALLAHRARAETGDLAPEPFDGELDDPSLGVVAGYAELVWVQDEGSIQGARWVIRCEDGRRLPATSDMLLRDSSGVDRELTQDTHRAALASMTSAARDLLDTVDRSSTDIQTATGALEWLLIDWLFAHRDSPESAAVEIAKGKVTDAIMIVDAAWTLTDLRAAAPTS